MLNVFDVTRVGYNSKITVGEIIEHEKRKYIAIQICQISFIQNSQGVVCRAKVLVQLYGSKDYGADYKERLTVTRRFNTSKINWTKQAALAIGSIQSDTGLPGVALQITAITSVSYDFTDAIVKYEVFKIREWSQSEMEEAIRDNRLSKFKVLERRK